MDWAFSDNQKTTIYLIAYTWKQHIFQQIHFAGEAAVDEL
jgi:hypothetical protein